MIIQSLDEYLETVAGYIFDDDKVVTYKWLSKELEVHVDVAKQVLWKFWQRYKEEKTFDRTFLLMGILHDDGMRVEVVKEKDLAVAKEKYVKILSEHIYSLQKALPEIQLLEMTEGGDIRYSAIKCIENNERSDEELHILRWGTISNEVQPVTEEKINSVSESVKAKEETSPEKKSADKKKNAQKKGFDSLFGKAANKQKAASILSDAKKPGTDSTKQTLSKENVSKTSKKTTQGGLSSFLQQNKNEEVKNTASSVTTKNSISEVKDSREKETVVENRKKQSKQGQGKKRNRSKDVSSTAKRRKRITIQSDSSDTDDKEQSEELKSDEEQRNELESSPEVVPPVKVPSDTPPPTKVENGKRKVLKTVDKTFEEDGYLVTKKVHVYESCSEDEAEVTESKKPVAPEPPPETKGKKSNKQTTLMNFFRKV